MIAENSFKSTNTTMALMQWNRNPLFLGVILGITSFGVESTLKLEWNPLQSSVLNHSFESGSTILNVDFHSKMNDP